MDYKRFSDENYKHWLQAAESLYILRSHIREFVENETENFHKSLREKLRNVKCESKCSLLKYSPKLKKFPICDKCEQWKDAILQNHNHKGIDIPWNNCQPHLWPTDKWEVAKANLDYLPQVYMIRGVKSHRSFDQFDVSSILNFMYHCKYFQAFAQGQYLTKVINVRNKVMHSPDFSLKKEDMDESINSVQELAKILVKHAPGLKTISEKIQQFKTILERCSRQVSKSTENSKEESLKLLGREQHALKEKIEFLAQRYEENQGTEIKEELQGMKNFLDQNKDLLEDLAPQLSRLDEIQEKVNKHEQVINTLKTRVDCLEKGAPDPMFTGDPLKFKNHVFEVARKRKMPEPEFMEDCEAGGYRGIVNVNGKTFRGMQVCNNKRNAHQEVARIVLEFMESHPEWGEEAVESISSSTASSTNIYYGIVTVELNNQELVSDDCDHEQEATESAYRKLAFQFGLTSLEAGNSFRTAVLEHFQRCNFPTPLELSVSKDDKFLCKLQISGHFTFYDKDGSSKKKQAEQKAAKVALQNLSGILNCRVLDNAGDNWKGLLKESLDALGLQQPDYNFTVNKVGIGQEVEGAILSEDNSQISATKIDNKNDSLRAKNSVTEVLDLPTAHTVNAVDCQETETLDFSAPEMSSQAPKELDSSVSGTIFYSSVTVVLNNQGVVSDGCDHEQEATESAYRKLACQFGLNSLESKTAVLEHFQRCNFPRPQEFTDCEDNKFFCKLLLTDPFIFFDKDGSSKKKQSEQQAARIALQHLSGLFKYSFEVEPGKNYKGILKEKLDALGLKNPEYEHRIQKSVERPSTSGDYLLSSCMTPSSKKICLQPNNSFSQECLVTETQYAGRLDKPNKPLNMDNIAINRLLALFNLQPPSVNVESISTEMIFTGRVDIKLEKFTFQNNSDYTAKKDAIRKTYLLFGNAMGIYKTKLDENNASMLVKQHFSQNDLTLPKEVFQNNKCSLNDITYNLFYDGEGSTEVDAKRDALQKALETLTLLFGFSPLPKCSTVEETEVQINSLLKTKGQKDVIYSPQHNLYKNSVELLFKEYTMESKQEKRKKDNTNYLSGCILDLLAVKPETQNTSSLRNCLDEWFKQNQLKQPVFENTEEAHGSKVTFSVKVSCSNPDWEDSVEVAEEKLVEVLRERLNCLAN
ncbi:hypothetical protein QTP70_022775 [Hemibagrus guttatus]|uniref:DRBM domain-containing protein n=1 Tax=Hemibagrus guttatus TaxID=175788 RepID=A0AAE0PZ10_9TELE|nr:hypothetical protein QTP70_022775 [Hemibagrus guttatus]